MALATAEEAPEPLGGVAADARAWRGSPTAFKDGGSPGASVAADAEAGALMSWGPDGRELARRAASYVVRILRGVKPWNLPVEQSTKVDLVINVKAAKALELTIPPAVLARADHVIR